MGQKTMGGFLFFQLSNEERESAIRYLLEAILKVRDSDPELARGNFFDEDVNVYLAHLLFAMSLPEYHDMADPFLSSEPKEITEWVKQTDDPMLRYFIYKVNADHRLVHSTIFSDRPAAEIKRIIFRREENGESRLAVAYYDHASRYHKGIYHKRTGVGEVLDKIAARFDVYSRVLFRIREDYFQFVDCFREQAFRHFFLKLERYEKESRKDLTLDRFLEAYQKWLSLRTPEARRETLALAGELAEIDPNFRFDPSKLG